MLAICRPKEGRVTAARPSAWRRSASGHAFAIVWRIARCSLRIAREDLARVEVQCRAVEVGHLASRLSDDQRSRGDVPGRRPNSHNASNRPQATQQRFSTAEPVCRTPCVRITKASQKVK